jgi:hypothetical protein
VTNANSATAWFLRDGENCLVTEPFSVAIAEAIGRLVTDGELRLKLASRGRADVTSTEWKTEFDRLWRFIVDERDALAERPK